MKTGWGRQDSNQIVISFERGWSERGWSGARERAAPRNDDDQLNHRVAQSIVEMGGFFLAVVEESQLSILERIDLFCEDYVYKEDGRDG
jgi:hypothetical protein